MYVHKIFIVLFRKVIQLQNMSQISYIPALDAAESNLIACGH